MIREASVRGAIPTEEALISAWLSARLFFSWAESARSYRLRQQAHLLWMRPISTSIRRVDALALLAKTSMEAAPSRAAWARIAAAAPPEPRRVSFFPGTVKPASDMDFKKP